MSENKAEEGVTIHTYSSQNTQVYLYKIYKLYSNNITLYLSTNKI